MLLVTGLFATMSLQLSRICGGFYALALRVQFLDTSNRWRRKAISNDGRAPAVSGCAKV